VRDNFTPCVRDKSSRIAMLHPDHAVPAPKRTLTEITGSPPEGAPAFYACGKIIHLEEGSVLLPRFTRPCDRPCRFPGAGEKGKGLCTFLREHSDPGRDRTALCSKSTADSAKGSLAALTTRKPTCSGAFEASRTRPPQGRTSSPVSRHVKPGGKKRSAGRAKSFRSTGVLVTLQRTTHRRSGIRQGQFYPAVRR
jgi:hypothetical protein